MQHFINGFAVNSERAQSFFLSCVERKGYERENVMCYWLVRSRCESARDVIGELTDYQLEMITRD